MRRVAASLALAGLLVVGLVGTTAAARPSDPYISHMTGTAQWVVDSETGEHFYVLELAFAAHGIQPGQYIACVKVYFPGADPIVDQLGFPRARPGADPSTLSGVVVPTVARSVTVTAQLMRLGSKQCCTAVGALRTVTATLPTPPDPSDTSTRLIFDQAFPTP